MMHVSQIAGPWFGATGAIGVKCYSHGGGLSFLLVFLLKPVRKLPFLRTNNILGTERMGCDSSLSRTGCHTAWSSSSPILFSCLHSDSLWGQESPLDSVLTGKGFSSFPLDMLLITGVSSNQGAITGIIFCEKSVYQDKYFSFEALIQPCRSQSRAMPRREFFKDLQHVVIVSFFSAVEQGCGSLLCIQKGKM